MFGFGDKQKLRTEIEAYRKTIKLYDAFIFFNELELLELRLNILKDAVDYFVIVESTQTFSGKPKPLYYAENKKRFKDFEPKIVHYVTEDAPQDAVELRQRLDDPGLSELDKEIAQATLTTDNIPQEQSHWLREFYQKESIKRALVGLNDSDFCFISDVDEIWNPGATVDYRKEVVYKFKQAVYAYYLNNRSSEPWAGTYATHYGKIKRSSINHLDTPTKTKYTFVKDGGWHFTNQGGADRLRTKLESYGHQEYNTQEIKSSLEEKIAANKDFIGRKYSYRIDEASLPTYLKTHKDQYEAFFKKLSNR